MFLNAPLKRSRNLGFSSITGRAVLMQQEKPEKVMNKSIWSPKLVYNPRVKSKKFFYGGSL